MNSFSIAAKLFRTNVRTYGYYLAVMIFAVSVYYDFMALKYNAAVQQSREFWMEARAASEITSFVLIVILVFFIWYSSSFFLKQRKKEIGIYSLSGISNVKIGMVFAVETVFLGTTAICGGLALGILLSRLFFMALAKVTLLNVSIGFYVPVRAVQEVIITFAIVFIALSLRNFINVARSKLIDLIGDARKDEGMPGYRTIRGILAVILIAAGYYLSYRVFQTQDFLLTSMLVVILVVLGTFWLFGSFLSFVMRVMIGKKQIMYRGVSIVGISNVAFRLRGNYRSMAMLAVMAAVTITSFGTSLSLKYYVSTTHDIQFPYSFTYIGGNNELNQKVLGTIENSGRKLLLTEKLPFLHVKNIKVEGVGYTDDDMLVLRYSDFARVTRDLNVKNADQVIAAAKPSAGRLTFIEAPGVLASATELKNRNFSMDGRDYMINDNLRTPLFGDSPAMGNFRCAVVDDEEYGKLKANYPEKMFNGFIVSDAENSMALAVKLAGMMPEDSGFFAYAGMYQYKYRFIGLYFFLGAFMSIVFILATGSIMYFKLLSEGIADKGKYEILGKIGMSDMEIRKAVSMQVGISLILPLLVGMMHSLFAIKVLEGFLNYSLMIPLLTASTVFILLYAVFYVITTRRFLRLVTHHEAYR